MTLTGIVWLTQALKFIDLIVNRGLDVSTFIYLSSLLIPSLLLVIIPIALFVSVLMTYNRLISDSELIVMKSAGLSRLDVTKPALIVAATIALFGYLISLYLLPASYREFKETQAFIRDNYASVLLQEGVFSTPTSGLTVYIESREDNGMLKGILVHDSRSSETSITYMAQEGRLTNSANGAQFELINGSMQETNKESGNLTFLNFESYPFDLSSFTNKANTRRRTPEERYIFDLLAPQESDIKFRNKLLAEGHNRIIWPLYGIVLTLIALASLLSGQFNRRGNWKRIVSATVIGVVFLASGISIKGLATKFPVLAIFMYIHPLVFGGMCLHIIKSNQTIDSKYISDMLNKFSLLKLIKGNKN